MASSFRPHSVIFIIIAIFFLANAVNSIPAEEFDSMLDTLRIRGYELFCNAIVTSDLQFELLSSQNDSGNRPSFTFFAPIDSSLFALDMTQTASSYINTLRFHIVPRRLSISDLLRLPVGSSLPTLLPHRYLNVTQSPGLVAVGGVNVAFPGLFYGRDVAVHGLSGIISLRSSTATGVVSGSPVGFSDRQSFPPRTGPSSSENYPAMPPSPIARPVLPPIPMFSSFNVTNRAGSPPPVENILPVNRKAHAPAREPADANSPSHAASPFNRAVYPPEPAESNSLDNPMIHAPEDSHSLAASPFTLAVHPPEPDEPSSLDNLIIHAPEGSHSLARSPVIQGIPPASSTESPANIYVLPPVVSHAFTPTSESQEYRYSSISAPPLEYSDAMVPAAMSLDMRPPNKHEVTPIETSRGDSERLIKTVRFADEVPEMPPPLIDEQKMPEKCEPLDGIGHCVDPDVELGLQHSTHQHMKCRYVLTCE